jgi:hypothetical protein
VSIGFLCFAFPIGGGAATPCDPPDPIFYFENGAIDATVELVVPFTFGQSITFQIAPGASATVGYAANGDESSMTGAATIDVAGELLPAYLTDEFDTPIPTATVTSDSGFDYLTAPEPSHGAACALVSLLALRRRATASR